MTNLVRTVLTVFLFFNLCCISAQVTEPHHATLCDPIGDPIIDDNCAGSISEHLARAIHLDGFAEKFNWPDHYVQDCDCDSNPDNCGNYIYCDEYYDGMIQMAVESRASFLADAFHSWGYMHLIKPDNTLFDAMTDVVTDVNWAYDCAQLRRPIIQGTIFDHISTSINSMVIDPGAVELYNSISDDAGQFQHQMNAFINAHGTSGNLPEKYIYGQMNTIQNVNYFDITRVLGRLYVLQIGKMYIDAGYTSIILGVAQNWAEQDMSEINPHPFGKFFYTYHTLQALRDYADSIGQLLIIASESLDIDMVYEPGDGNRYMLFDYDNLAMRMQETGETLDEIDCDVSSNPTCSEDQYNSNPLGNLTFQIPTSCDFVGSMAWINTCGIERSRTCPGDDLISPNGCPYEDGVPYLIAFDFANGLDVNHCGDNVSANDLPNYWENLDPVPGHANGAYCMDDLMYFTQYLPPECARDWIMNYVCLLADINHGYGHIQMPGLWRPRVHQNNGETINYPWYMPFDSDNYGAPILEGIIEIWDSENLIDNSLTTADTNLDNFVCLENVLPDGCTGIFDPYQKRYFFSVKNPDCTSTYSWHLAPAQNPDNVIISEIGKYLELSVPDDADYILTLRRDNLEIESGTETISVPYYFEASCCCESNDVDITGTILTFNVNKSLQPHNSYPGSQLNVIIDNIEPASVSQATWNFEGDGYSYHFVSQSSNGIESNITVFGNDEFTGILTVEMECGQIFEVEFKFYPEVPPFTLFPNPYCETISIIGEATSFGEGGEIAEIKHISIKNLYGYPLLEQSLPPSTTSFQVPTSEYANGVYQVFIKDKYETTHYKMIEKFCY